MELSQYIFFFLSFVAIISALMMILDKNPVHSVLLLVVAFFAIAGHYLLLNAQFLAAVHIIVYAGAIMVLFLYVIMMLNLNSESEPHKSNLIKTAAVISGGIFLLVLVSVLKSADGLEITQTSDNQIGMVKTLGLVLYDKYMLPFEVSALLFLTAMIGATMIGKKEVN